MTLAEIEKRREELDEQLDNLEGCEDNEVYQKKIREIRDEISRLDCEEPEPEEFELEVVIKGTVIVKAVTYKEAEAMAYDECKNHDFIAVQSVEIEEA